MTGPNLRIGGTLDPFRDVYIARPADDELIRLLLAGEYVGILTSRQMGKSSLVNRAARILAPQGWLSAIVDLTVLGSKSEGPTYYRELIQELSRKLPLDTLANPDDALTAGSPRDLIAFVERISDAAGTAKVALFLDEIDSTLKLPYTDDLFTSIRAIYNERQVSGKCRNVAFCLIGVVMPDELVKDKRTTPYNVGTNIELDDFNNDRDDLSVLRTALSSNEETAGSLLTQILYWTGGQPYLTMKVVAGVRSLHLSKPGDIDGYIARTYGNLESAAAQDVHFRYILRFVEERWSTSGRALDVYERILKGYSEPDRPTTAHAELKLAGLVKRNQSGMLRVRNRVYEQLFDDRWIRQSKPKRQVVLYRRTAIAAGLASAGLAVAFGLYREFKVVPELQQLDARQMLADLRVSIEVVEELSWARPSSYSLGEKPDENARDIIQRAVPLLAQIFPRGAGLGIDLSRLGVEDISTLGLLDRLGGLDLSSASDNSASPDDVLPQFTGLKILSLSGLKRFSEFSLLGRLTQLRHLDLSFTNCSSLQFLQNLPEIANLSISSTQVTDLTPLQPKNLKYFYATWTDVSDISILRQATNLSVVSLSETKVSSIAPLADAINLESLFLVWTPVEDLEIVRNLPRLRKLSLNRKTVTPTRIDFLESLKELRELLLRRFGFEDPSPLGDLFKLERLDLSQTRISTLADLRHLRNIESLDISRTGITSLEPLNNMVRLQSLSLADTKVSTLEPLFGLEALRNLDLRGCNNIDLNQLRKLPSLQTAALDQSQLAQLPKELQKLGSPNDTERRFGDDFNRYLQFNLGALHRNYRGFEAWWSGPMDR